MPRSHLMRQVASLYATARILGTVLCNSSNRGYLASSVVSGLKLQSGPSGHHVFCEVQQQWDASLYHTQRDIGGGCHCAELQHEAHCCCILQIRDAQLLQCIFVILYIHIQGNFGGNEDDDDDDDDDDEDDVDVEDPDDYDEDEDDDEEEGDQEVSKSPVVLVHYQVLPVSKFEQHAAFSAIVEVDMTPAVIQYGQAHGAMLQHVTK